MNRPPVALLGAVLAVAVAIAVGTASRPAPASPRRTTAAAVVGAEVVCPALRRVDADQLTSQVAVGVPSGDAPADSSSSVSAAPLSGGPAPLSSVSSPLQSAGQVAAGLGADITDDAFVVRARGSLAAGLEAQQLTRAGTGPRRGYAGLQCAGPRSETWFAGGSLAAGESSTLFLVNPDDTGAVVDIQLWSAEGPVDPRPGRGVLVPARGRTVLSLDTLAPGRSGLAGNVVATRGRVAAALEQLRSSNGRPGGVEWVPATPPPATRVVVPALPSGPGTRSVLVTNPTDTPTVVQLQLTTGTGQFVPVALDALTVPAGSTVSADLTALLATAPAAVAVTSAAGPVLAVGVALDGAEAPAGARQDLAYAGAARALDGPALVTGAAGSASVLLLSALGDDASALVTTLPVLGVAATAPGASAPVLTPRTVAIPGGSTVAVRLTDLGVTPGGPLAVQVAPAAGSAPLYASVLLREDAADGPFTTLLTLAAAPRLGLRPAVSADPGAALP